MFIANSISCNSSYFKTRQEAKWAAFFTLCGWEWTYLPGVFGEWVPEFSIKGASGDIFVDVQSVSSVPRAALKEIRRATATHPLHCLVLGKSFLRASFDDEVRMLGWELSPSEILDLPLDDDDIDEEDAWDQVVLRRWEGAPGFCSYLGDYTDRISGKHDGSDCSWGEECESNDELFFSQLWQEADEAVAREAGEYRRRWSVPEGGETGALLHRIMLAMLDEVIRKASGNE
ncbi:hypothetical protein [Dethiosulfovibrio salsuginis]|uniref:Uncharacterized protein n=1 Tax=Dethiosulfovibrio salsuginis TaxID=561720 RepID=A0A1X7KHZ8_9BACT|nr:hypothetical protein [Dethiosulfovibrio salsuginis]SMG40968.1 hypothetical protein SAMN06275492_12845 [Dethiosulfovibrio salsuginis]